MMLTQPVTAGPVSIGINFSDGSAASHIGGLTVDGCSNWVDSYTQTNSGYVGAGYSGLAYGTTTIASGVITVQWNSATTWYGGLSSTSAQDLYATYLDDGNGGSGNLVPGGSIGVSVTFWGISKWLFANQATRYQMRFYCSSSDNLSQMTTTTPVSVRLGAPNPANGSTQLTGLAVLETDQLQWLGDGGYPTSSDSGEAARGYGDSSPNLSNDPVTITIPYRYALPTYTRGSLAAIKLTPANPILAPTGPLTPYEQSVTNDFPMAFWRLNETNGVVAFDSYGNYNGTINTGVTLGVSGPLDPPFVGFGTNNTAMLLNGATNSYLTMPTLNLNTNTVTITGWMNPSGIQPASAGVVFCRGVTTVAGLNFATNSNNELRYTWNGARNNISTGLIVPTNQWSFFALVVSPTNATLYLGTNDVLNSYTDSVSETNQAFDGPLLIGFDSGGSARLFNGSVADVAVYDGSLTPAQIQSQYITAAGCLGNPSITSSPTNQTVIVGTNATFSVSATGPTVLSYQWQVSTNGGASFFNIAGATNASYTTPLLVLANSGNQYRGVANGLCGTPATSAAATVTVIPPPLDAYGSSVTNLMPQAFWRLNETNGASIAYDYFGVYDGTIGVGVTAGEPGPENPPLPGFGAVNTAMLFSGSGSSYLTMPTFNLNTNVVTITGWMNPNTMELSYAGVVFCRSGTTSAGVNFSGAGNNQLQYTWGGRSGVNTGLTVPTSQWSFFALVVTPSGATLYLGTNGGLNSFTDVTPESVQAFDAPLLIGFDSSSGTRLYSGELADVALFSYALTPTQIQSMYIIGAGCPGNPTITTNPVNQSVVQGSAATFISAATGPTVLSYQWQISTNSGASFLNVAGATNPSYTTPITTLANSGSVYRVVVSGLCGTPATSAPATLSVSPPAAYPIAVTNNQALAYWRLTETNGTTAYDYFGVYNGTIEPGVVLGINGPRNPPFTGFETNHTAMSLTGASSSYLQMPTFNYTATVVSVTGWINPSTAQADWAGVVVCRTANGALGVNFGPGSSSGLTNELQYSWGSRYGVSTGLLVPTNQWSFFALTLTPNGATIYLGTNGVLSSSTDTYAESAQALNAPLMIGFDPSSNTRLYRGGVSEVALYNGALTLGQIQQIYFAAGNCPGNPSITTNPANQSVTQGSTATFVSAATGPTVVSYQWQISTNGGVNFLNLAGATNTCYTTPVTTLANSGSVYRVVVTGECGAPVTSSPATLTVGLPPLYTSAVTNDYPLAYWRLNETSGVTAHDFFGVNNGTIESGVVLGINGPQNPPFTGFETNHTAMLLTGSSSSYLQMPVFNISNNVLTITGWINPSTTQPDWAGVVFWRNPGVPVGVNFGQGSTSGLTNELQYSWGNRYGVSTGLLVPTNQWSFFALVVTPSGATVYLGTNGVFNSFTDTTPEPAEALVVPMLIGYDSGSGTRMFKGGVCEVALYTNALTAVQLQQLYIAGAGCPGNPSISTQPVSQTVMTGSAVSFSVGASGLTPVAYQWQVSTNGGASFANVTAATNSTYTTPVLTTTNNGIEYQVVITGLCGAAVTSSVATVSVTPLPSLAAYVQAVTNGNALAYWRLTETNGTTAYDFYGVNNGTIEPGVVLGINGPQNPPFTGFETNHPAMLLTGSSTSYLQMPVFNITNNVLSITGWINPSTAQSDWAGVVFWRNAGAPVGVNFGQGSTSGRTNELQYTWGGRFGVSTGLLVPTNQWSFFALVVTPGGTTVYLGTNGVFNSSTDTTPEPAEALTAPMLIGYDSGSGTRMFKGGISEVALYTNALTGVELQQMYIAGAGCPGNPSISSQPASQTVIAGSTASFTVAASGPTLLAYQWQTSTNGGASFANISGATNSTYTTPALALANSGTQYQVVISGLCGSPVVSAVATATVNSVTSNVSAYAMTVTNSSPVAYWRLNEPAGSTVAHDFFGVNNGTIEAGIVAGVAAQQNPPFAGFETNKTAMQLNGSANSYIQMPTFNINSNVLSITGWIDPSAAQSDWAGVVFCRASSALGVNFGQGSTSGLTNELQYTWGGRFGVSTGLLVPTNQWSFFALVVTPGGATVYLGANGALSSSTDTYGEPAEALGAPLMIGYDTASGARMYKGLIDEVALYNYALTPTQIEQFYITSVGCPGGPAITNQPVSQTVQVGSTATFTVGASGGIVLSYQWQSSTNGGATYAAISGATNASYTTPSTILTNNGTLFEVVVSGLCGSPVTSSAATLTVNQLAPPLPAYAQAVTNDGAIAYWRMNETNGASIACDYFGNYNGVIGSNVTAGVPGPQSPLYPGFETNNTAMLFNGLTGSFLTMPALYVSNNVVSITGWINPSGVESNNAGIVFCRGGTTVAGLNFGPGSTSGLTNELRYTWNNTRNNVSTGLLVPTNQWSFFALVVSPSGATLYLGANQTLYSYFDSTALAAQAFAAPLYIGSDGTTADSFQGVLDEIAVYKSSLTPAEIQQMYFAGAGCPGNPTVTMQPTNVTVQVGSTATFSVTATGPTPLSYQWQVSTNGGTSFGNISGATNSNYTTPATVAANNGNQYQAVISGLCGTPATSSIAVLGISVPPPPLTSGYSLSVTSLNPYAYWRLNETNGATIAYDFYGIYNGAIGSGVIAGVPGQPNPPFTGFETNKTAMELNGSGGSYLTMPTLNLNTNTVTITGWINPSGVESDWTGVVFCRSGTTVAGLNFGQASYSGITNELRFTWNNNYFSISTGLIVPSNQWSFVALSVTSTGATVYVGNDAVLSSYTTYTSLPNQPFDNSLMIGIDPTSGTRMFQGLIDEVTIFKHSLTPSQIQGLYTSVYTNGYAPPPPYQSWQMHYFGSTNNYGSTAPTADYTGTGMSNTNKFMTGFNPTNPAAYLHIISIATTNGTNIVVTYLGASGDDTYTPGIESRTNVLEFTTGTANGSYTNGTWTQVPGQTNILSGGNGLGTVTNMTDIGGASNSDRYYRIRILLP